MIPEFPIDTVRSLYASACRWRGTRDFFVDPDDRFTGHDAWQASVAIARTLAQRGLDAGDRVAFICAPSARHATAWFGVPLAGGVSCSLHIRETPERLGEAIEWLGARFVIFDPAMGALADGAITCARRRGATVVAASLGAAGNAPIGWNDLLAPVRPGEDPQKTNMEVLARIVDPDMLAAIVFSSGSTGRPKGVMHTQRTLVENAKAGQILYGTITTRDATLIMMQPSFAAWMNVVVPCVGGRGKIVFGPKFTPAGFLQTLAAERITIAPAVPTMWRMILAEDTSGYDLSAMKNVSISGEPPAASDLAGIAARICRGIASFYASGELGCGGAVLATEADTMGTCINGQSTSPGKPETTGKPVAGADVRIVDPSGSITTELPAGEIGEIVVRGTSTAIGYWRDEPMTRARFVDGWWRSGDVGCIDPDGDLFVVGRLDNVINTGGIKVHGEEIERVLLRHPAVAQAAVIGLPDARLGERIEAHIVLRAPSIDSAALDAFCRGGGALAGFKVPKRFHFVERLPTGPTGKIFRRGLR